jgi:predicted ribosomally synthesized peptide with SipW-like signal peptide
VSIRTDVTSAHRSTITKTVASLGVVGAAAAVAGMGTFGSFTDSTTPVDTNVDTGTISINLSPAAMYATVPVTTGGFLPGDSSSTPFDVANDRDVAWESVTFTSWATTSSVLDSDPVNGLQLTLASCSTSWTVVGSGYACGGDVQEFYSGPIVLDRALADAASLTPGGVDHLLATIDFPASAGDQHKNKISELAFTFTAVQRDGAAR